MDIPSPAVRVLVVDDNLAIHEDFRKILCPERFSARALEITEAELFGTPGPDPFAMEFEVVAVADGVSAIAELIRAVTENGRFAVVFQDVRMGPGLDGVETALRLWQIDPELQIVLCTAFSDYTWRDLRQRFGRRNNLVYLKKPFEYLEVLQLAHTLAERWEAQRAWVNGIGGPGHGPKADQGQRLTTKEQAAGKPIAAAADHSELNRRAPHPGRF